MFKTTFQAFRFVALVLVVSLHQTQSFTSPNSRLTTRSPRVDHKQPNPLAIPRGGETELNMATPAIFESLLFPALRSGPYGVVALTAIAATAVVPLTLYKQLYAISVGYGAAIFLIGLGLQMAFQPTALVGQAFIGALLFYGFRLGSYLLLREVTRKSPSQGGMKESPRLKRLPLALSVSLFYAFLTVPALATFRNIEALVPASKELLITQSGIGLAVFGAVLEAVADLQKYLVKQSSSNTKENEFYGPIGLTYQLCRHPNYLGEILFWTGVFVAGIPSFGTSVISWLSSVLGLYGKLDCNDLPLLVVCDRGRILTSLDWRFLLFLTLICFIFRYRFHHEEGYESIGRTTRGEVQRSEKI